MVLCVAGCYEKAVLALCSQQAISSFYSAKNKPQLLFSSPLKHNKMDIYSGTFVLWTPWDQQKKPSLLRCPDFHEKVSFGTSAMCVGYICRCPY